MKWTSLHLSAIREQPCLMRRNVGTGSRQAGGRGLAAAPQESSVTIRVYDAASPVYSSQLTVGLKSANVPLGLSCPAQTCNS